jgi:outer membrane protein assembly factor BamA
MQVHAMCRALAGALVAVAPLAPGHGVAGAQPAPPTGLEVGGVPAVNFDSDEGFGYGAVAELYQYGDGSGAPYVWTVQPTVFLTTGGRRDLTLFFDAPHVLPDGWRLDGFFGSEKQIATPYYGVGNGSGYDEALDADDGPNPYFYRFGRSRASATLNLQRTLGRTPLRALLGAGVVRTVLDPFPEDDGLTLYAREVAGEDRTEWSNYVRAGIVWDSRDRQTGPRSGTWTELLVQRVDEAFGADRSFTRWTFTHRRYVPLGDRVVLANRTLLQQVSSGAPLHELYLVQTSFKQQEGLGGAKTVRGLLKNRFVGRGMLVWNAELRWRFADFGLLGRPFHAVLSAFVDQGRVWSGDVRPSELLDDLHRGFGGGVRVGMGENFVVALDVGTSEEADLPMYIGLGYLY